MDIKGSIQTVRALSRENYKEYVLDPHLQKLRELVMAHRGRITGTPAGDSIMAAFWSANDAIDCAVEINEALRTLTFTDVAGNLRTQKVRIGIHTSLREVTSARDGLYLQDEDVIYAARIMGIAHEEQILVSANARAHCDEERWAGKWKSWPNRRIKDWHETAQVLHELKYDAVERGEPGSHFLPDWFREQNQYIPRPVLEKEILDYFQRKTVSGAAARLVTLHGFGGMGKTRLAMQCCVQAASVFEGRLYCATLGLDTFTGSVSQGETARLELLTSRIAAAFGLTSTPENQITPDNLHDHLPKSGSLLLFLDSFETVAGKLSARLVQSLLVARPELFILTTGRERVGLPAWEFPREIVGLEPEIARALLLARVRQLKGQPEWSPSAAEEKAVATLLDLTDRIPLALELVAAHTRNKSLTAIAESLNKEAIGLVTRVPHKSLMGDGNERHQSLESCLNWSWILLPDDESRKALACLSLFADKCLETEFSDCFPDLTGDPLEAILDVALVSRHEDQETGLSEYSLLRPTRAYARERLAEIDLENHLQRHFIAHYRNVVLENGGFENQEDTGKRTRLQAAWRHAISAGEVAVKLGDPDACAAIASCLIHFVLRQTLWDEALPFYQTTLDVLHRALGEEHSAVASSLNNLALLHQAQGSYELAEPLFEQALEIRRSALGEERSDVASSLNNLAMLYQDQGRYELAEPLLKQAFDLLHRVLGEEHTDTATSLNNLASLYYNQGRYELAEPLLKQALEIRRRALGGEHPDIASSLNNLASLHQAQGIYELAELLFKQALEIRLHAFGNEHPIVASSLNNLALLHQAQGRYELAEPLFKQALEIRRRALGIEHPDSAASLNDLASLYYNQGRYELAEPLLKQTLEIRLHTLGDDHPIVANSLNNLALLYYNQGRYELAEPLFKQALAIRRRALGIEHPDSAASLNDLAALYSNQGRYELAEPLLKQALEIRLHAFGEEHPIVADSLNNLASLYHDQGHYALAESLFKQALDSRRRALGGEHPYVAQSLNNLASLYYNQGRYELAEPLLKQTLEIRLHTLGDDHPIVANSLNNLASLYQAQGHYERAEPYYTQALEIRRGAFDDENPYVATSLNNLASTYKAQQRYKEAETLFQQALDIRRRALGEEHPDVAASLNNLASLYKAQGHFELAEPLLEQALEIALRSLGPRHPNTMTMFANFMSILNDQNRDEVIETSLQAKPELRETFDLWKAQAVA